MKVSKIEIEFPVEVELAGVNNGGKMKTIEERIKKTKTMPELDELRLDVIHKAKKEIEEDFNCLNAKNQTPIQQLFIKQKNKLKRIPVSERDW